MKFFTDPWARLKANPELLAGVPVGATLAREEVGATAYDLTYSTMQTLTVNVPTDQLFSGAQLMIDALSGPYMLIAGIGLGVAILGAIIGAIRGLKM